VGPGAKGLSQVSAMASREMKYDMQI
jgi:hypothetical protein